MRRCWAFLTVAALVLSTGSAIAQAQGLPLDSYFGVWSSDRAQLNLRKQAACAVRKYPTDARQVVVEEIGMREILNSMPGLTKPCGDGALFKDNRVSMSQPILGLVFAEALVKRLPSGMSLTGVSAVSPLKRDIVPSDTSNLPPKMRENVQIDAALLRLDAASECAVRRDPEGASALARSEPRSDMERVALQRTSEAVRACDAGAATAPPFVTRGLAAYNLYRLMDAAHLLGDAEGHTHA